MGAGIASSERRVEKRALEDEPGERGCERRKINVTNVPSHAVDTILVIER